MRLRSALLATLLVVGAFSPVIAQQGQQSQNSIQNGPPSRPASPSQPARQARPDPLGRQNQPGQATQPVQQTPPPPTPPAQQAPPTQATPPAPPPVQQTAPVQTSPQIQQSEFVEDTSFLRVTIGGKQMRLESYIVRRADLTGRLPVALIAHGKPATQGRMLEEHASDYALQARDLARRGYLAAVVMRRGFGASDGPIAVPVTCATTTLQERFGADADDLQAAFDAISKRPDADPDRWIVVGVSAGGAAALALSARMPAGLAAVINVSGGLRFEGCPKEDALVAAVKEYGEKSRIPQLWVYAQNDSLFPPALSERMHSAFLDGGGNVKFVMLDAEKFDGHAIFAMPGSRLKWLLEMDAFLRYLKLPTWKITDVDSLMKKLHLPERDRGPIEAYVAGPSERALVRLRNGPGFNYNYGNPSLDSARRHAIEACEKRNAGPCDLLMENDRWVGPTP